LGPLEKSFGYPRKNPLSPPLEKNPSDAHDRHVVLWTNCGLCMRLVCSISVIFNHIWGFGLLIEKEFVKTITRQLNLLKFKRSKLEITLDKKRSSV